MSNVQYTKLPLGAGSVLPETTATGGTGTSASNSGIG